MLRKGIYKTWITSDKASFYLSFTTGETKIQRISREKHRKEAALLEKASKPSGVMVCMEMSSQGSTQSHFFFVKPKAKIDATFYQQKVMKHMIKESKRLYLLSRRVFSPPRFCTMSYCKINYKMAKK
ncbi:hypothetical protein TNCV_4403781 [Trichonephila clavipes]|uniref:Uncharacterized protein n=1 Tax=Trichonephila clavipes TaxID=2585209 RepID=A0A8X6S3D9_TRICX|nr:hypothetical protein TNCV_4403781 [Trichonephila clavipes]